MLKDITIHLTDREGISHTLIAPLEIQLNLMEICKAYELPVEGTCGGMAMCASCQCYIESSHPILERSADEEAMLSEAFHVQDNSRLGCQIQMSNAIDGLIVRLAPSE